MKWLRSKWRKFRRFLTSRRVKPQPSDDAPEIEMQRRNEGKHRRFKRVAFVNGHTDSKSGCSTYAVKMPEDFPDRPHKIIKRREYDVCKYIVNKAKEIIDLASFSIAVKIFFRDGIGISGVGRKLEDWNPDLVLSFHLNSVGVSDVEGREILCNRKYKGTAVEDDIRRLLRLIDFFLGPSPLRGDGGIRWTKSGMRGDYNLDVYDDCKPLSLALLEPEFVGKKTTTAKRLLEGAGLHKYSKSIAYFAMGYDVKDGIVISPQPQA